MSLKQILKNIFLPKVDEFIVPDEKKEASKEKKNVEFPELKDAWTFFKSEKFDDARAISEKYAEDPNAELQFEAKKLIALTYFRQGNYEKSEGIFETLCLHSTNPDDWFHLVTSLTLNSKFKESEKTFSKTLKYHKEFGTHENISIPNLRFYYMQGLKDMKQFDLAFTQLIRLTDFYRQLKITDSTFLYMRGVPFFEYTIDSSKEILENIPSRRSKNWIDYIRKGVDKSGANYLTEFEKKLNYTR